ncbi:MAG: HAD family phosphatase [Ginsengibacter sp.]
MEIDKTTSMEKVSALLNSYQAKAVIFDLDGTLINNNSFHLQTWKKYLEKIGKVISQENYNLHINGRTNHDAIEYIYGRKMSTEESSPFALEKEALYREIYQPFIKPINGLIQFLEILNELNIPMAIATSGIQPNIDFMFNHIAIKKYFPVVVNSSHIKKGKPDPEIYLKAAALLEIEPKNCLVFEDAVVGIQSAKSAGMKVIALATTHLKDELKQADTMVDDYDFWKEKTII